MSQWLDDLAFIAKSGEPCVVVTVTSVRGSAPREPGAKMIVTRTTTCGTIGGGQLEYQCTRIAAAQLRREDAGARRRRRRFPLGANCGQCCGGVVDITFEQVAAGEDWPIELARLRNARRPAVVLTPADDTASPMLATMDDIRQFGASGELSPRLVAAAGQLIEQASRPTVVEGWFIEPLPGDGFKIAVFGAGHTGSALVAALAGLDCRVRWIESRRNMFPETLPDNVTAFESNDPANEVAAMPPGSYFVVMTHSHPLDFDICSRILGRADAAYCGLIGSRSKRRRFEKEWRKQGMDADARASLTCPIGINGITSKKPADIAIAVAAELLAARDAASALNGDIPAVLHERESNVHAI